MWGLKECRTCHARLPVNQFWFQNKRTGLLQGECKSCMRQRNNRWQRVNYRTRHPAKLAQIYNSRLQNPSASWFNSVKSRSAQNGTEFSLERSDFVYPPYCPVLGIPMEQQLAKSGKRGRGSDNSPSLDRIDNKLGYTPENTVIVSYRANRIKSDASIEELRRVADWYEHEAHLATIARARDGQRQIAERREQTDVSAMLSLPA